MWRLFSPLSGVFRPIFFTRSYLNTMAERDHAYDISTRLLESRIICIHGPITDHTASVVVSQLLFIQTELSSLPIHLYINSPGGVVTAGLAIYDTMQWINSPVYTFCCGQAAGIGSLLLAAGAAGKRLAFPNARLMIQPYGTAADIARETEMPKTRELLKGIYIKHCRQPIENIEKNMDRNTFMSPEEAKEFGLIDVVIEHRPISPVFDAVSGGRNDESKAKGEGDSK